MTNKQKVPSFADFLQELKANKVNIPIPESREQLRYFLIVSEGTRTEPLYFEYLASLLPQKLVDTINVHGAQDNTINVVKKAIQLRNKRLLNPEQPPYDEVWAVYDKDDFPDRNYNDAIQLAISEDIESGHSNESFELWYVLHFHYLDSAISRDDYKKILSSALKTKYEKNDLAITKRIHIEGNVKQAILWAHKLEQSHAGHNPASSCPQTRVYVLADRLMAYIDNRPANF